MNDDELDEKLRLLNPASTPSGAPLTARQLAVRERIIATPVRRRTLVLAAAITAPVAALSVIVTMLFAVLGPVGQQPAVAYGPAPLSYSESPLTAEEAIRMAQNHLAEAVSPVPPAPQRAAQSTSWRLVVSDQGEPQEVTFIEPIVTELSWQADLSGVRRVTAGETYTADGDQALASGLKPGTLIDETHFAAGEYPAILQDAALLDEERIRGLLNEYAPLAAGAPAGDAFWAVLDVFGEWTLTNEQHARFLGALLDYPNLKVLGTTQDRLGRDVLGLQASMSTPGETATLLLSTTTGRIVGIETSVTSAEHPLAVPKGTVIAYILWKDNA
ncbi:hypothetical protein [Microbacterium sp.]|uniref:hypothetical protein n=1 Tax=Microbacterium sp. TaxID=51671 RepID=UPI0028121ED5|nr:hypothetical protein [Microbacterium sp.]